MATDATAARTTSDAPTIASTGPQICCCAYGAGGSTNHHGEDDMSERDAIAALIREKVK